MQLFILSLFLLFQSTPQDTAKVNTSVNEATVYLDGAEVHRSSAVNLQQGTNYITFGSLSSSLNEESIGLRTEGDIILESISKSLDRSYSTALNTEMENRQNQKQKIEDTIKQKQAALKVLDQKLNILLANQDISGENVNISAAQLEQTINYFGEQFEEIEAKRIIITDELAALNEELKNVNRKIYQIERDQERASGVIEMAIYSDTPQQATLNLSYFVSRAGWFPSYDVRVDEIDGPLNITYKANVSQATGVDWNNVQLTVSSANPQFDLSIPTVSPFYLRFYEPQKRIQMQANQRLGKPAQREFENDQIELNEVVVTGYNNAELLEGQTAFSFKIENPYIIQSNGSKIISVQSYKRPASYQYLAIPKKQPKAFLAANINDWESLNLLRGEASLFLDQSFVGKTTIDPSTVQDTLTFSLGEDEGIVIERKQIESFKEKNFFGNKVTETKGWDITIRNTKSTAITINVLDQIPLSSNEDIEIDLKEHTGATFNESTGQLKWTIQLGSAESRTLRFIYETTYPSDKKLIEN